jgi:PAS domain-containing protein
MFGEGSVVKALVDLFWAKYGDLRQAVDREDDDAVVRLDRELDPLIKAILGGQGQQDQPTIRIQFRFALDLLNEEADDRGCVRRNAHLLQMLVERYLVTDQSLSTPTENVDNDSSGPPDVAQAIVDGSLDDSLLNKLPERVVVVAPGYRIFYSNETNARRMEMPRDELIGRHFAEFVGLHHFRHELQPGLDRCFEGDSLTLTYADKLDGETVVVHCRMSPITRSSTLIGALVVMQETTDRRRRRPAA